MADRFASQRPNNIGFTTRMTNGVLPRFGYTNRATAATTLRGIASSLPEQNALFETLQRHQLLKSGVSMDMLPSLQASDLRVFSSHDEFQSALGEIGDLLTEQYDPDSQALPTALTGNSALTQVLVGLQLDKQRRISSEMQAMRQSHALTQKLAEGNFVLTDEIRQDAVKTIRDIRDSASDIPSEKSRTLLLSLCDTIEGALTKTKLEHSDYREIGLALAEINDIAMQFRNPDETGAHKVLVFGSAVSRFLSLGFMASIVFLGTRSGYTNLDRSFYWVATFSLGLYAWMASNFMKIVGESEQIPNLEFTQGEVLYRDLPREITKRFSNGGLAGGIGALLQDFYLNLVFGNHDVILNNDPNNSFYQSTYGDAREVWRVEKRAALIEREIRMAIPNLDPAVARRMAGVMAMGAEREVPSHYSLLEATQDARIHLGKVTKLLFKVGERGGEYATLKACSRIIDAYIPEGSRGKANEFFQKRIVPLTDRLGLGFFLSESFDETVLEMAREEKLSEETINGLRRGFEHKREYAKVCLKEAAKESGIDEARAEAWVTSFLRRVSSEENIKTLSESTALLLNNNLDGDGVSHLIASLSSEFGIDETSAGAVVGRLIGSPNLERDARALNGDYNISQRMRGRLRDLAHLIMFHERTGDERVHEEGNFAAIAENAQEESYLRTVLSRLPTDFLFIDRTKSKPEDRKGSFGERIFLSMVQRGIGERTAQTITDEARKIAAEEYNSRFSAEAWERRMAGETRPWWEVEQLLYQEFSSAVESRVSAFILGLPAELGISQEKSARVLEILSGALSLHHGILNRTVDGFLSLIAEDATGIRGVAEALSAMPGVTELQKEIRAKRKGTEEARKRIRALLQGETPETIKEVMTSLDLVIDKGIGVLRAEARFQDGNLLSFDSIASQIPGILLGEETLHRTMLDKENRYQQGTFQEYDIVGANVPEKVSKLLSGKNREELADVLSSYVEARGEEHKTREALQITLRGLSRELDDNDPRIVRIRRIKEELETHPSEERTELLLREMRALESQIHQTREKVKESSMEPLTSAVMASLEEESTVPIAERIAKKIPEIIVEMTRKEGQKYGLGFKKENEPIIAALRELVAQISEESKTSKIPPSAEASRVVWGSSLFFERMNYEKWKGSKGANNDSGLGFYIGERLGVKLYSMLEYMTTEKVMIPPDILAPIFREFCDKVRFSDNYTEDQRIKEERGVTPKAIASQLIDRINRGESSAQAVASVSAPWNLSVEQSAHLEALRSIASEVAVRTHGSRVLGFVSASNARKEGQTNLSGLPENTRRRAESYLSLSQRYGDDVDAYIDSLNLSKEEKKTLRKEASLMKKRFKKNRSLISEQNKMIDARIEELGDAPLDTNSAEYRNYQRQLRALEEERLMRIDRVALFHPEMHWSLYPAIEQPMSRGDRWLQFIGERLQERRRAFIIPETMTAEETAAKMMTMANNRMPMRKLEKGILMDYGKEFLTQARAIDAKEPKGFYGKDLEETAEGLADVSPYLDTNKYERPIESDRDVVRDVDTDNFLFESSQAKANAYWQKRGSGLLRSYSAILQTQQFYPETHSRLSSTQNLMGVLYSTVLGKAYGKRGKQVIMGCYIVKNRRAVGEAVDWVEIPFRKRQEDDLYDEGLKDSSLAHKDVVMAKYRKTKLLSEVILGAAVLGVGGAFAFSGLGLAVAGGAALSVGALKFLSTKNPQNRFSRMMGYGLLTGAGAVTAIGLGAGVLSIAGLYIAAGVAGGLAIRKLSLAAYKFANKSEASIKESEFASFSNREEIWKALQSKGYIKGKDDKFSIKADFSGVDFKTLGLQIEEEDQAKISKILNDNYNASRLPLAMAKMLIPTAVLTIGAINPLAGAGILFGSYHYEDLVSHLPYNLGIDTRRRIARLLGLKKNGMVGKWLLQRQKMIRMYEEEEVYSQPDDVEDFGSSPAIFQRGYHSDFHQSADGVSDDVKDKGTLDGQRGRWHGGMEGNLRAAISAYLWDRQAMEDIDWMRYILQTLGPAGSFSRLALNINLWAFLGTGVSAFAFGMNPVGIVATLAICSGISFLNYAVFMRTLRSSMNAYGSNPDKTSDMLGILDSLSPTNVNQGVMRIRFGMTPPFLTTKSPHEPVATYTGNALAKIFPFWPVLSYKNLVDLKDNLRTVRGEDKKIIDSVVQSMRVRFGYFAGSLAALSLAIPGIAAGQEKSYFLLSMLVWAALPIYYATKSISVVSEGSSPFGRYGELQKNPNASGLSQIEVEERRLKALKAGIKASAFPEINSKK